MEQAVERRLHGRAVVCDGHRTRSKAASTFQSGYNRNGSLGKNADLVQRYRGPEISFVPACGCPTVSIANTPYIQQSNLDADIGVYIQDSWRLNRADGEPWLALEIPARRFDVRSGSDVPGGTLRPGAALDAIQNLPNWNGHQPALSASRTTRGGIGHTALKASVGKYTQQEATGFSNTYNRA